MQEFLKWLAGMGNDPLPPGESLRFEFLAVPEGGLGFALLVALLAAVVGIFLIYRRDAHRLRPGFRLVLATLRLLALITVVTILLEPSLVRVRRVVRPGEIILLTDISQSMGHKDSYRRSEAWADAWHKLGIEDPSTLPRLDLAKAVLKQKGLIPTLAKKNRLRAYVFGSSIRPAPERGSDGDSGQPGTGKKTGSNSAGANKADPNAPLVDLPPPPDLDFAKILATEGSTNLTASIRQAIEASRKANIPAVILVTDGRKNAGGSLEEVGAYLKRRGVNNVFVLPIGDPAESWKMEVRDIQAAERVFKGDPVKVSAVIQSQGFGDTTVPVVLKEILPGGKDVRQLAQVNVEVGGDTPTAIAKFPPVEFDREGGRVLQVEIQPPDTPFDEQRHVKRHKIDVLGEKLRVLLVAGGPSHEFRILRNQLIRDKLVDVACWMQSADPDFPQEGNTSLKDWPKTAQDIDKFDVVIMIDPSAGGKLMVAPPPPPEFVTNLSKAIRQRGVGLWWVMGEKFSLGAISPGSALQQLVDLLPVVIDVPTAEKMLGIGVAQTTEWRYALTPEGQRHRVCRLFPDPVVNATLWSKLPGYRFAMPVLRVKPAAQVLIRHASPERMTADGKPWPILALQFLGAGRVLYTGTDELHRWFGIGEKWYETFWNKGLRWLYEGKLAGGTSRFRLGVSAEQITLGEDVEVYLRALDERFEPLSAETVTVRVNGPSGSSNTIVLDAVERFPGRFKGRFRPSLLGSWQLSVDTEGKSVPVVVEVGRAELESEGPMDLAGLQRFAEVTGGEVLYPNQLVERAAAIPSRSQTEVFLIPRPLWDSWFTLALFLFFVTLEWVLRKRANLL